MNHHDVQTALRDLADPSRAAQTARFFKTGPGQYGEGDKFLGVAVPNIRKVTKDFRDLPLDETEKLLTSDWHEDRLAALLILVWQYPRATATTQREIYDFYLAHTTYINNWDFVDASAEHIVGPYLAHRPEKMDVLKKLAHADLIWERRIAMLATFHYIRQGRADEALDIIDILLHDTHDLIRKATGWMLREIGKRVDRDMLLAYLDAHAHDMPRTTLRYAVEHLPTEQKQHYMQQKK